MSRNRHLDYDSWHKVEKDLDKIIDILEINLGGDADRELFRTAAEEIYEYLFGPEDGEEV